MKSSVEPKPFLFSAMVMASLFFLFPLALFFSVRVPSAAAPHAASTPVHEEHEDHDDYQKYYCADIHVSVPLSFRLQTLPS